MPIYNSHLSETNDLKSEAKRIHHLYQNGNPISEFPWKKWARKLKPQSRSSVELPESQPARRALPHARHANNSGATIQIPTV